jgi:O-antigen/teichoic acid export membrane protein
MKIEKLSTRTKIAVSTGTQVGSSLLIALGAVGILRVITHRLGPTGYGTFTLVIVYVSLVSILTDLGISAITTRDLTREGADQISILSVTFSSRVVLSVASIPVIYYGGLLIFPHESDEFRLSILTMSFDVLFTTVQATAATVFAARVRGDLIALMNLGARALYFVGVILVAMNYGSYLDYISSYVGADAIVALLAGFVAHRMIRLRWSWRLRAWKQAFVTALPLGSIQVASSAYAWIDSILVSSLGSKVELGFYSVGFNIVSVLSAVPGFLVQALTPTLVNAGDEEVERLLNRIIYSLMCVAVPITTASIVLRADLINIIAGPRFHPATTIFLVLVVTVPVTFVQNAIAYISLVIDRFRSLVWVSLITLSLNVAINIILIPRFGGLGAAFVLLGTDLLSLILTYIVFTRITRLQVDWAGAWRPIIAAASAFLYLAVRGRLTDNGNHYLTLMFGVSFIGLLYIAFLRLLDGMPAEVRRRRPQHKRSRFGAVRRIKK